MKKILLIVVVVLIAAAAATWGYITWLLPRQRPAPELQVTVTPELLQRGQYLVEHVLLCNDCHSERDWTLYGGPPKPPFGAGRPCMTRETETVGIITNSEETNFPGQLCIRNITPDAESGIGQWSDGEVLRAMREGVDRHGRGLFPIMPYHIYKHMADEDAEATIAYMRSLPPVRAERPERTIDFPLNLLIQLWPEPLDGPVETPDRSDTVRYGEYLATIARCSFCHTPREGRGREGIPGKAFAGGVPFALGTRITPSRNLTPHETGIGAWTREAFIARFRQAGNRQPVESLEQNTLMNWNAYSGMTEQDLGAIYDFLRTLPPVPLEIQKP
jgi:mono/diheme cytochrome c family protein